MAEWVGCGNIEKLRERIYVLEQIMVAYTRQQGYCIACGEGPLEDFETHHVKPRRLGGTDSADNLEIVCPNRTPGKCHYLREVRSGKIHGVKTNQRI